MPREKLIGCRASDAEHATITADAHAAGHPNVTAYLRARLGLTPPPTDQQPQANPDHG